MAPSKKALKPLSGKKPPDATATHADVEEWIGSRIPAMQPILCSLDETIRTTIPGVQYAIKWKRAYYGLPKVGWIIELAAYEVSVNIVFFGGAELDPPPPLGTTDRSRYVKVTTVEEANDPAVEKWIKQARRVPGWR